MNQLEVDLEFAFTSLGIDEEKRKVIEAFLAPLKQKSELTYEHSIRVGLLAKRIGRFVHLEERALFYAGILHDIGKIQVPVQVLNKTEKWSKQDQKEVERHVMDAYRILRGKLDFSAEIILWHHRFQKAGYPSRIPRPLHAYSQGTKLLIAEYGRIVAIADMYDALHRVNDKFGGKRALTSTEIKEKMLELILDRRGLVEELYSAGILFAEKPVNGE